MRASAALLSSSRSIVGLAELVHAAGFASASIDLDAATRQTLRLDGVRRAELAAGAGVRTSGGDSIARFRNRSARLPARRPPPSIDRMQTRYLSCTSRACSFCAFSKPRVG